MSNLKQQTTKTDKVDNTLINSQVLLEFFQDENVNFPSKPNIIKGISTYNMPNGIGVQFRGGSEKLILKGKNASLIWSFLSEKLTGGLHLDEILVEAKRIALDANEVARFIKILHSSHLFESSKKESKQTFNLDINFKNQKEYYDRIVGYTAHYAEGIQVLEKIGQTKVLIIANSYLVPIILQNFQFAGFKDIGILYVGSESDFNYLEASSSLNITLLNDISNLNNSELRDLLNTKLDDYQYTMTILNSPNFQFIHEISRLCSLRNKPLLSISFIENSYEVGPFFFPNEYTACSTCLMLRRQSHENNSVYDFIYQDKLNTERKIYDTDIKGFDIQAFITVLNIALLELKHVTSNISKSKLINKLLQFNTLTNEIKNLEIIQVLGCPTCSSKN